MKRLLILVYTAFLVIVLANFFYYKNLYNKQIRYISTLLDRQVQIVGLSVDNTNYSFTSDLNEISFSGDLALFFSNPDFRLSALEKMKLFFSKYQDFVTGIKLYDINKNEFTLKKDEVSGDWLEQQFILHMQGDIYDMEKLVQEDRNYNYYLPILKNNVTLSNIVVTVDYQKYFDEIFSAFNLKDYQWQWVISDSGRIIYDNVENKINYTKLNEITTDLENGTIGNLIHEANVNGKTKDIISSYYSTQLLGRDLGLIFSAPTDFFHKYIVRNSLFIVLGTLLLIQIIIYLFWKYIRTQKGETKRLSESEKMLFKLIEEMPVGVIIHNKKREIIKANKVAATLYSYPGEEEMKGQIFPETPVTTAGDYFAKNLGGNFNPEQFIIIKKEAGEVILYKNSIPVVFKQEEAQMEILIDVTMLESARKQEAKANVAKSEFLARMSYEIRTPLNGIIGITDVISKYELSEEIKEIIALLRRSTEVLLKIINDILDFSKIETGKMILDEIPFNLREEIGYCTDLMRTYLTGNEVVFTSHIDKNVPESIIGDPFRLRQVLTNLFQHSAKNTEKGEIQFNCRLKSKESGIIKIDFELLDTGTYFDKISLGKIFGDYRNIDSKTVKSGDDSVFGTILARQLIELMGGELKTESPSGLSQEKGTKILFTITTYSNDRIDKSLKLDKITSFDKIKTLVITGHQNRDEELLISLHKLGLNISVTTFQKSTIEQIKANLNYLDDMYTLVIILDDKDFDGFNAAKSISENKLSGSLIILMISSNDKKGNYLKCITMGIDHYLVKPLDVEELIKGLQSSFPYIETQQLPGDLLNIRKDIKILIVEDNKMNQKVIGQMLRILGYTFDTSDDGYEGYLQAKKEKYDLIFMDLLMPEMDGFEAARKILFQDKSVLIVAFTADNMPESKRKAELSGIKEFITKPVRLEELKRLFAKYFKTR